MPVSAPTAYHLLHAFGMLEFALKRTRGFLGADGDPSLKPTKAKANWDAFDRAVVSLPATEFVDRISLVTKTRLLGGARNRPKVQFVNVGADGSWSAHYRESALPPNDALALMHAMRRVRNNLFHGGKEDPLDDPNDEDERWAVAAVEVAELLLNLLDRHMLRP